MDLFSFGLTDVEILAMRYGTRDVQNRLFQRRPNRLGASALSLGRRSERKREAARRIIDLLQGFCDIADWIVDDRDAKTMPLCEEGKVELVHYMLYGLSGCKKLESEEIRQIASKIQLPEDFLLGLYASARDALKILSVKEATRSEIRNVISLYIQSQKISQMPNGERLKAIEVLTKRGGVSDIQLIEKFFSWNTPLFAYFLLGAEDLLRGQLKELRLVYEGLSAVNIALDSMLRTKKDVKLGHNNFLFVYLKNCQGEQQGGPVCDHISQGVKNVILNCKKKIDLYGEGATGVLRKDADFHRFVLGLMTKKHYARLISDADMKFETKLLRV